MSLHSASTLPLPVQMRRAFAWRNFSSGFCSQRVSHSPPLHPYAPHPPCTTTPTAPFYNHKTNSPLLKPQVGRAIHAQRVSHSRTSRAWRHACPSREESKKDPPNELVPWNYTTSSSHLPHTKPPLPTHPGWLGPGCGCVCAGHACALASSRPLNRVWPICFNLDILCSFSQL